MFLKQAICSLYNFLNGRMVCSGNYFLRNGYGIGIQEGRRNPMVLPPTGFDVSVLMRPYTTFDIGSIN